MFQFLKRRQASQEPLKIVAEVDIEKPCADVYALLDFADERNAKRALGYDIREVGDNRWQMIMTNLPDLTFLFDVRAAEPGRRYAFDCVIEPALPNFLRSNEDYELEPLGDDSCRITLTNFTELRPGLSQAEYRQELATMATATHSALQKFKLQAEKGAEVTKAIENNALI